MAATRSAAVRADRSDRRPCRSARNMDAESAGDYAPHSFAGRRVNDERFVLHALLQLETPNGLRRISRFVNVDWHSLVTLLARLAFWRPFRLGRFLCRLLAGFHPLGVKNAGLVNAFVSMRTEEIALGLKQIRRQPF
jgi:hypothetical protein